MKRAGYAERQITGILKEHDAGAKCAGLCRRHRMSEASFYTWMTGYGSMAGCSSSG